MGEFLLIIDPTSLCHISYLNWFAYHSVIGLRSFRASFKSKVTI